MRVILIVGGGTGWLLQQVLTHCQPNRVVYLEASAKMLALASRRVINHNVAGSVVFRVGDETCLKPDESFDVIMTPFVLDLFTGKYLQSAPYSPAPNGAESQRFVARYRLCKPSNRVAEAFVMDDDPLFSADGWYQNP